MKKSFVLDTNVLIFDPQAIYKFQDNDVVVPISVIEELDNFKKDPSENGRNARQFSRFMDVLRKKGVLSKGVPLDDDNKMGMIQVIFDHNIQETIGHRFLTNTVDNRILLAGLYIRKQNPKVPVVIVSKDTNLRIKADVLGLRAVDYEPSRVGIDDLFSGVAEYEVSSDAIDAYYKDKHMPLSDEGLHPNEYVVLRDEGNANHSAIGRFDSEKAGMVPLINPAEGIWGITPRNLEQKFGFDCLLNDDFDLVSLVGKAGTGKTLLAIAAGLSKTLDEGKYQKLLVSRPIFPMGRDIGFLPGDIGDKLNPWMQPIFDNIDFLMGVSAGGKKTSRGTQELINQGMLNIEPITYIRGRSIPNQFLIIDEAQNLTPHEIKTIITRAGENTKVVLTGDCFQIDNPYIDSSNNGLMYVVEKMKHERVTAHVTLQKGERSRLAELAANLL